MIITPRDPASITGEERLSEIAAILAGGYMRMISRKESRKELDESAKDEAPCDHVVNSQKNRTAMEEVA